MAALASAYGSLNFGESIGSGNQPHEAMYERDDFAFLPNIDPATFVHDFQNSSSVDHRLVLS